VHSEQRVPLTVGEDCVVRELRDACGEKISHAILAQRPAFLARRRADIVKVRNALSAGDFALIQSVGHNCKGIGTGYGCSEISSLGLAIENAARTLDENRLVDCLERLERYINTFSCSEPDEA